MAPGGNRGEPADQRQQREADAVSSGAQAARRFARLARRTMISDDELLLYYYRDGLDPADRSRIGAALSEQPELGQRLHRLVARLDAAASLPEVPVPTHVRQRWQAALERAAHGNATRATSTRHRFFATPRWQTAAAAVAVLALVLTV